MANGIFSALLTPKTGRMMEQWHEFGFLIVLAGWLSMNCSNAGQVFASYVWRPWHGILVAAAGGACVALIAGEGASPFLYFQF
jgi:hypothetical protein